MADPARAHPENAPGELFVDATCIDCPTCRQLAPGTYGSAPEQAVVARQPETTEEWTRALMGLVSCPTGSIGTHSKTDVRPGLAALPERIGEDVYACGFASADSFGAQSYLLRHPSGNVLVDSPRAAGPLLKALERLGGVRWMLLTHSDDVADHERIAARFGAERVLHEGDALGELAGVERTLAGEGPWTLAPELEVLWTPGHTRGHVVLRWGETLFSGDHVFGGRDGRLDTSWRYCQHSWTTQIESVRKLAEEQPFVRVLPGHGYRYRAESPDAMRAALRELADRMERGRR